MIAKKNKKNNILVSAVIAVFYKKLLGKKELQM
jgi:hypothetical protein